MMCSINEEKIIYKQSAGFGSVVYYTCMIIPEKSIQVFRYSSGNLCGTKLFCVNDIANLSFSYDSSKLTQEQIDNLIKFNTGKSHSEETKKKLKESWANNREQRLKSIEKGWETRRQNMKTL